MIQEEYRDDLASYGKVENLGSHPVRKGVETFVLSGSTVDPSIIAIFLRYGWKNSGAKERYLKFEGYGDQ